MRRQAGFTLIELVMVIVILGILSAFALPRFADLGTDARIASLNGLVGAMKSASAIARSQQLVDSGALGDDVTLDGQDVTMVNGYPTADADGIIAAAGIDVTDYPVSGAGATGGTTLTFTLQTDCTATYTAATAATDDTAPITGAPVIEIAEDSGC